MMTSVKFGFSIPTKSKLLSVKFIFQRKRQQKIFALEKKGKNFF